MESENFSGDHCARSHPTKTNGRGCRLPYPSGEQERDARLGKKLSFSNYRCCLAVILARHQRAIALDEWTAKTGHLAAGAVVA